MKYPMPNKYQRMLKLKIIKRCFESLVFEYFHERDVYEVYNNKGKRIHAAFASKNVQEIIDEIMVKRGN